MIEKITLGIKLAIWKIRMRGDKDPRPYVDLPTEAGPMKRFYIEDLMAQTWPEIEPK